MSKDIWPVYSWPSNLQCGHCSRFLQYLPYDRHATSAIVTCSMPECANHGRKYTVGRVAVAVVEVLPEALAT